MIYTDDIYADRISLDETPEIFFQRGLQEQPGVPYPVNPYAELQKKFYFIKDKISEQPVRFDADFLRIFHRDTKLLHSLDEDPEKNYWYSIWEKAKERPGLQGVGCFRLDRLDESVKNIFSSHPERISRNAYFTINTYFRAGLYRVPDTRYPVPARAESNLAFLNACYVDIDGGRFFESDSQYKLFTSSSLYNEVFDSPPSREEDIKKFMGSYHWQQILLQALILEQAELIPEVSIFARSGRGVYLIWLLEPVRAFEDKIDDYKRINKFLGNEVRRHLFPADTIHDAARVLRLHGTTHSGTNTQVCYYPSTPEELAKIYTLDELKAFCGPKRKKTIVKEKVFKDPLKRGTAKARSKGVIATAENRIQDFLKFQEDKGGIDHGIRYYSLSYLIRFMRIAKYSEEHIWEVANQVAANCNPPYPCADEENDIPVKDIIKREFAGRNKALLMKNSSLAKFWQVDKETAERLNLCSIKPDGAKYTPSPTSHKQKVSKRKEAIIQIFQNGSCYPRQCLEQLKKDFKIDVSLKTVKRDIDQLRKEGLIANEKNTVGRPKKQ
jgi:hypothetical protein